ncbi:unnamed protein product [Rotaria socialis]
MATKLTIEDGLLQEEFNKFDKDKTGRISAINFRQVIVHDAHLKTSLITIELKQAFDEVDTNKDGFISPQEARLGITFAGQRIPGSHFSGIVHMFDDNGDGKMSFEEFSTNVMKLSHE